MFNGVCLLFSSIFHCSDFVGISHQISLLLNRRRYLAVLTSSHCLTGLESDLLCSLTQMRVKMTPPSQEQDRSMLLCEKSRTKPICQEKNTDIKIQMFGSITQSLQSVGAIWKYWRCNVTHTFYVTHF